jgi:glycosyltransferase involved in cell wall biosynthesis
MASSASPVEVELSFVIPVYNGAVSIANVVGRIGEVFAGDAHEIVLVDDGSIDNSAEVCHELCVQGGGRIMFAGLARTRGRFVAILDDDGQNPPEELPRMVQELKRQQWDVIYGRYRERQHTWPRRLGSWLNDRIANIMLGKPPDLYLSSFKVLSRFVVNEIIKYQGPYPYIDGLICRTTNRLGQVAVEHAPRRAGASNYTLSRLARLWLNMALGFSVVPLRITSLLGMLLSFLSTFWLLLILIDKLWLSPEMTAGIPTVLACLVLFSGVQLMVLGMIGEYVGRLFLTANGQPQYVVRTVLQNESAS